MDMLRPLNVPLLVVAGLLAGLKILATPEGVHAQLPCTSPTFVQGLCSGPAMQFQFTAKGFQLKDADGNVLDLIEASEVFDAASVAPGATVKEYASGLSVISTTYTEFRILIDPTINVKGSTTTANARTCRTCTNCTPSDGAAPVSVPFNLKDQFPGLETDVDGNIIGKATEKELSDLPLVVSSGDTVSIDVAFNTGAAIAYNFDGMPPVFTCTGTTSGSFQVEMSFKVTPLLK